MMRNLCKSGNSLSNPSFTANIHQSLPIESSSSSNRLSCRLYHKKNIHIKQSYFNLNYLIDFSNCIIHLIKLA